MSPEVRAGTGSILLVPVLSGQATGSAHEGHPRKYAGLDGTSWGLTYGGEFLRTVSHQPLETRESKGFCLPPEGGGQHATTGISSRNVRCGRRQAVTPPERRKPLRVASHRSLEQETPGALVCAGVIALNVSRPEAP